MFRVADGTGGEDVINTLGSCQRKTSRLDADRVKGVTDQGGNSGLPKIAVRNTSEVSERWLSEAHWM